MKGGEKQKDKRHPVYILCAVRARMCSKSGTSSVQARQIIKFWVQGGRHYSKILSNE